MLGKIVLAWCLAFALFGVCMALRLMKLKRNGTLVLAEIIAVREKKKNTYTHTLRYEIDGKLYENDDKSGFNIAFNVGDKELIYVSPADVTRFEYEKEVKKNIILWWVMVGAAFACGLRFMF